MYPYQLLMVPPASRGNRTLTRFPSRSRGNQTLARFPSRSGGNLKEGGEFINSERAIGITVYAFRPQVPRMRWATNSAEISVIGIPLPGCVLAPTK